MRNLFVFALLIAALPSAGQTPDWSKINDEAMRHFQALVQIDSSDPPGNETRVAEYVKKTLEADGIQVMLAAKDPGSSQRHRAAEGQRLQTSAADHGAQRRGARGPGQMDLSAL